MSFSPPLHIGAAHTANGSSGNNSSQSYSPVYLRHQEDLINAYEAEEERIINVLSRKLEKVCGALLLMLVGLFTLFLAPFFPSILPLICC